jgi:hypothetical protein
MDPPDSKIADLLPRIVERAARRSDEKEEEPWVKPTTNAISGAGTPAAWLPAGTSFVLLGFVLFPAMLAFLTTGLMGRNGYLVEGASNNQQIYCTGAPLVHTVQFQHLGTTGQFFPAALLINGLMWVAIAGAIWWSLHVGIPAAVAYWGVGRRRFTIGQLLAVSVGVAMAFSAWRWDMAANVPGQTTLAAVEKAYELGQPAGPAFQPLFRFSFLAAAYAYVGVGCAGLCLVSGGLWVVRQFLPRRPGEDKSLLQQIF